MNQLGKLLDLASLTGGMSHEGHESDRVGAALDTDDLVTTGEAANLLGLSDRQTRRLRSDLDGEMVAGRMVFRRATIIEYAQERRDGRHSRSLRTTPTKPV
jgi:hypothetical protein